MRGFAPIYKRELFSFFVTPLARVVMTAFLVMRGIKTLELRMERHSASAAAIADMLAGHPAVAWVSYPLSSEGPGSISAPSYEVFALVHRLIG